MTTVTDRVVAALQGWFTEMALQHCGRDYGSERWNQYHFYRRVYKMTASEAWRHVNAWPLPR